MKLEVVFPGLLHTDVWFLRILRCTQRVGECIRVLGKRFCVWFWWLRALLVVVDYWCLSVEHVKWMLIAFRTLYSHHFSWFSIGQGNHLIRD